MPSLEMDEVAVWNSLPAEEQLSVWGETEQKFWAAFETDQEDARAAAENDYHRAATAVRVEMGTLDGKRFQLAETRDRLSRELTKIEAELARVAEACDEKATCLAAMEQDYRQAEQTRLERREQVVATMEDFFCQKRGEYADANADAGHGRRLARDLKGGAPRPRQKLPHASGLPPRTTPTAPASPAFGVAQAPQAQQTQAQTQQPDAQAYAQAQAHAQTEPQTQAHVQAPPLDLSAETLVHITDADGNVIGPVKRIDAWNQWVKEIQDLPIKRQVKIRRGRKFNLDHLATIYDRSEGKGVKWLSCMIQATGEIQPQRCHSCDKNQGAFDDCIVLGGPLFQKCGNCEWNRQGCHMSLLGQAYVVNGPPLKGRFPRKLLPQDADAAARVEAVQEALAKAAGLGLVKPSMEMALAPTSAASEGDLAVLKSPKPSMGMTLALTSAASEGDLAVLKSPKPSMGMPLAPTSAASEGDLAVLKSPVAPEPVQMPTPQEPREHASGLFRTANGLASPAAAFSTANGFTPANGRSRPPSRDTQTPSAASAEDSPVPTPSASSDSLEEITRENLVLRHNGTVYTYPEIVEGVPVRKIDQSHPYWELGWPCIKSLIEPQLESWREKNVNAQKAKERGEAGSARFQTGRQVNRGGRILEFLEHGEISPYQLLAKSFTTTGKGAITSYDTLFRLCETLSELAKFKLDVTPVEWLRHRLHEIYMAKGASFNVSRTIHDFYHDPKLSALRSKNGYKSIGRPSGYKPGPNGTPQGSSNKKRQSLHSQAGTPRDTTPSAPSPLGAHDFEQSPMSVSEMLVPPDTPLDGRLAKRPKHHVSPVPASTPMPVPMPMSMPAPAPGPGSVHGAPYSDADSWSGAPLTREDWRVYQVKTRLFVSSAQVTQYWTWKDKERLLEHQVLKDTAPLTWGIHRDPIDFNVRFDDVLEVRWNVDALMVHLVMKNSSWGVAPHDGMPRGDMMAAFKRERTIRRFLRFCRDRKLRMVEVVPEDMDAEWGKLQPERLPVTDEEASEVLKE